MEKIDLSTTITYVTASSIPASEGRKCVDGRYLPGQASGMIARPGGDGGYVMALMAVNHIKKLGLTPEQCFNAVYKVVSHNKGFCIHTDQHVDPESMTDYRLIGCGHLAMAATKHFSNAYDLQSKEMQELIIYARSVGEIEKKVHLVTLSGDHQEQGVLLVNSKDYTVLTDNPKLQQMYFVYDAWRDNEFLKKLVKEMHIPGLTFADMKHESALQLQATLHNLAKGLPQYTVSYKKNEPKVSYFATIS